MAVLATVLFLPILIHDFIFPPIHADLCKEAVIYPSSVKDDVPGYIRNTGADGVIVFVHGIRDDGVHCWQNSNGQVWPKLVASDTPGWDVFVDQYEDSIPISAVAAQLSVSLSPVFDAHKKVVVVAHSMGGLVIREFLLGQPSYTSKVPIVLLFATPSMGSKLANVAAALRIGTRQSNDLRTLDINPYLSNQVSKWKASGNRPRTVCAYETRRTWFFEVVGEASAQALCDNVPIPIDADHAQMAKPGCSNSYQHRILKKELSALETWPPFIEGEAFQYGGGPLSEVDVAVSVSGKDFRGTTDALGKFKIDLPGVQLQEGNKVGIRASKAGFRSEYQDSELGAGVQFRLRPSR